MTDANSKGEISGNVSRGGRYVDMSDKAVEERWHFVRQLTIAEWVKKGIDVASQPMRKDVERLIRLHDKQ
jgi:hypothetical protein